jgi:hypothetical protein
LRPKQIVTKDEYGRQRRRERRIPGQESQHQAGGNRDRHSLCSERPVALLRVEPIGRPIPVFIDDLDGAGEEAERENAEDGPLYRS